MTRKPSAAVALLALSCFVRPQLGFAQTSTQTSAPLTIAPPSSPAVQAYTIPVAQEASLTDAQKLALMKQNIKYVFVLFQENRSFDFYFGSYPGANGLFSQPAAQTPGFVQTLVNTDGSLTTISPFRIPLSVTSLGNAPTGTIVAPAGTSVPIYPADTDSVNHSHTAYQTKIDLQPNGTTLNDGYATTEEGVTVTNGKPNKNPTLAQKQMGELVMGYIDCNTAPVMWSYADRGVLFDNFHQTVLSASTPNALAMIAGQSGETQWVKHPQQSTMAYGKSVSGNGLPVVSDGDPYWGSQLDIYGSGQPSMAAAANPEINLTFATLPLSFMGSNILQTVSTDRQPLTDLTDVEKDIMEIAGAGVKPTNWGWYQQGYDHESTDTTVTATHADYIAHHNGPQYFGYVSNNPAVNAHLHGLGDFFTSIQNQALPSAGGVFYLRGGYNNIQGLNPQDPNPALRTVFYGDDDHPGYSDVQISSALLAQEVNAIANSPYWSQSAIIITYDETDGLYDHAPEVVRSYDPYGDALDQGPRIPHIVLSPYGVVHGVAHEADEHSSIIKFIDMLYGLTPLADLPDEATARTQGQATYGQPYLGPADDVIPNVGNMLVAFDNNRLTGAAQPLPASFYTLAPSFYASIPQLNNTGCSTLQITPTDTGLANPVPVDFNPRPSSDPGTPTAGTWTP